VARTPSSARARDECRSHPADCGSSVSSRRDSQGDPLYCRGANRFTLRTLKDYRITCPFRKFHPERGSRIERESWHHPACLPSCTRSRYLFAICSSRGGGFKPRILLRHHQYCVAAGTASGSIARQRSSLASLDGSHLPGSARFAFLVLGHERRQLLWFEVTRHPTAAWLVRQVTEAFPWTSTPCVYRKSPCLWQAHAMLVAGSRT